jgi:uncharacterized protein YceK
MNKLILLIPLVFLTGCASFLVRYPETSELMRGNRLLYRATLLNLEAFISIKEMEPLDKFVVPITCAIDLPFSFTIDTLCLPWDCYCHIRNE